VNNLLIRCAVPVLYADQPIVAAGGLISYGTDAMDNLRIVDTYVGRILKGEKPADLPVQQPSKFQFIIDLQTARLIGVTMPPSLLTRADEIIE
jgi:putative ABC transport system substrate-binding protein